MRYMIHVIVTFSDANGEFGQYSIRYLPTKNIKAKNFFELLHFLDNEIKNVYLGMVYQERSGSCISHSFI